MQSAPKSIKNSFYGKMVSNGHEVHIITSDLNCWFKQDIQKPWGTIHRVPIYSSYASVGYGLEAIIKLLFKTIRIHSHEKFDVINIHSGYSVLDIPAYILSLLTRVPIVVSL